MAPDDAAAPCCGVPGSCVFAKALLAQSAHCAQSGRRAVAESCPSSPASHRSTWSAGPPSAPRTADSSICRRTASGRSRGSPVTCATASCTAAASAGSDSDFHSFKSSRQIFWAAERNSSPRGNQTP